MARKLEVVITGDSAALERSLNRSAKATETFGQKIGNAGRRMESVGKTLTTHLTLPIVALGAVMVKSALDGEKSTARLDVAFKNAGLSATKYAKNVDVAESAGRNLGFTNEETRQSLGSLITSTSDVGKSMRELAIAENLARFKNVDLETATKALTMANAGQFRSLKQLGIMITPITAAVDALRKAHQGVKGPIDATAMAAAKLRDKLATQASVLDIVQAKTKGMAGAFANTAAGGMAQFHAQISALSEKLGTTLLPILNRLLGYLQSAVTWFSNLSGSTQGIILAAAGIAAVIGPVVGLIGTLVTAIGGLSTALMFLAANPIVLAAAAVALLAGAIAAAVLAPKQFQAALERLGVSAETSARVIQDLQRTFEVLKTVVMAVFNAMRPVIQAWFDFFNAEVKLISDIIHGRWGAVWADAKAVVVAAWNVIKAQVSAAIGVVVSVIGGAVGRVAAAAQRVGNAILNGIKDGASKVGATVTAAMWKVFNAVTSFIGTLYSAGVHLGQEIINGIGDGITSLASMLYGKLKSALGGLVHSGLSMLGIGSPSKVTRDQIGVPIMQGIAQGITDGTAIATSAIATAVRGIVAALRAQVAASRGDVASAFSSFASAAASAFDTAGGGSPATRALAKKLKAEQDAQKAQQDADAAAARDKALADAQASGDPAAIAAAEKAIADAKEQARIDADAKALAAAQKRDKDDFEKQLAALQAQAGSAKTEKQLQAIQAKIKALLAKYGITPATVEAGADFNAQASLFGAAMGDLRTAIVNLTNALNALGSRGPGGAPPFQGGKAAGGFLGGSEGTPIPIMAHANEYVLRSSATKKIGVGALNYMNRTGNLPMFQTGGLLDPTDSSGHTLEMSSAVGSGIPYEIWRRQRAMAKYAKREARIYASRALYNPAMMPTPASAADTLIDSWMQALSNDALFTERLGALKSFVDSGDAYRGGAVSRSWLTYGVPKLATGGSITRDGLYYGHKGETVTPAGVARGGVIHTHVYLDGKEIGSSVSDYLTENGRRGGPFQARLPR